MKRFYTASLALLLVVYFYSTFLSAQPLPRFFPCHLPSYYTLLDIPAIKPLADGGYLLSYGYGNPNIHAAAYHADVICTDSAWVPRWNVHYEGRGGLGTLSYGDSTVIWVGQFGNTMKFRTNGAPIWGRVILRPSVVHRTDIVNAHERGGKIVSTGTLLEQGLFGYSSPVQIVMDTSGNILSVDSLVFPGNIYTDTYAADKAPGGTWLLGSTFNGSPGGRYTFLAHLDTSHTITTALKVIPPTDGDLSFLRCLPSGDVMLGGGAWNQQTGEPSGLIARFDSAGNPMWAATIDSLRQVHGFHELPGGDLLVLGTYVDSSRQHFLPALVRISATGTVIWARHTSFDGSGFGPPFAFGPNALAFPVMANCPALVQTDAQFQNSGCPLNSFTAIASPKFISTAPVSVQVWPYSLATSSFNPIVFSSPSYVDSCFAVPVAVEAPEPVSLEVYPNPTNGQVHLNAAQAITCIRVIDALGQEVAQSRPGSSAALLEIPVKGPHWLEIELEDGSHVARMVVRM